MIIKNYSKFVKLARNMLLHPRRYFEIVHVIQKLTNATIFQIGIIGKDLYSNMNLHEHIKKSHVQCEDQNLIFAGMPESPLLYLLVRILKPDIIVETGVASGLTSTFILQALHDNKKGRLYSIDLSKIDGVAYPKGYFLEGGETGVIPRGGESGWMIPLELRYRWTLISGRTSEKLLPLLEELEHIDIFLHDSEHSYKNMLFEYQSVLPYIRRGGGNVES
ncbi:hypothetical protein C5S32_07600 [ANME-1 cluster archaeon GoMg1]|nr:hypothetical protein [ANME-1 cluster archaeon GoMg1]